MPYLHDVFLSYRHRGAVYGWVHNHFYPRLKEWLEESTREDISVFIDTTIETGASWPQALRNAVATSRLMVAVFSPQYFSSRWCQAEFQTMLRRQDRCGIPNGDNAHGLILPVKFNDGEHFSDEAKAITHCDLSTWSYPYAAFEQSQRYLDFADAVQGLAETIVRRLSDVPAWDDTWDFVEPETVILPPARVTFPSI